jgi:chromosomal replication initiation ATPase DnaA
MTQFTFDLPCRIALGRSDFLVSDSNTGAVTWVERWPEWPRGALVLHGPPGCGKTHLVHFWCERASAVIVAGATLDEEKVAHLARGRHRVAVDDADCASELALLHLYNFCLENHGSLLITARRSPASWSIALDDLRSRVRGAPAIEIGPPDDALLGAVLVKQFADRQLSVTPELITYLTRRMERSFAAAIEITTRLDKAALRNKSAITLPLARNVLEQIRVQSLPLASDSGVT